MGWSDYTYREAEEADFPGVEDLFERRGIRRGWAAWKYLQNPDGIARVFIAEDPNKTIVGTLAYVPRRFWSDDGRSLTVMQAVDVFVNAELRDRGVFLGLLTFARRHVDETQFGVPNRYSAIFASGPGWRALGPYYTWRFPILIGRLFDGKTLAFIAPIMNGLTRIYQLCWLPGSHQRVVMKQQRRFRRDYTFDRAVMHGVRSADYLNWRFVDNPVGEYSVYEFFEGDESIGYCVFTRVRSSAILSDFVAARCPRSCLNVLVQFLRNNGISYLRYAGTGLRLGTLGFIRYGHDRDCVGYKLPEGHWLVNSCDIDSEPSRKRSKEALS